MPHDVATGFVGIIIIVIGVTVAAVIAIRAIEPVAQADAQSERTDAKAAMEAAAVETSSVKATTMKAASAKVSTTTKVPTATKAMGRGHIRCEQANRGDRRDGENGFTQHHHPS